MARRAGKAANRRARQRHVRRSMPRPVPAPTSVPSPAVDATVATETVTTDPPPVRPAAPAVTGAGSTLTLRERAEYHYVERDLRNIGILTVLMAVLLFAAWFAFNVLGLT